MAEEKAKGVDRARVQAIMDARRARLAGDTAGDTAFFEGGEGYIHPIRGSKGYSRAKAGEPRKSRKR